MREGGAAVSKFTDFLESIGVKRIIFLVTFVALAAYCGVSLQIAFIRWATPACECKNKIKEVQP
jgi:hypothetical protein